MEEATEATNKFIRAQGGENGPLKEEMYGQYQSIDDLVFQEMIDITSLFVINGRPGLYMLRAVKKNDGILPVQQWLGERKNLVVRTKGRENPLIQLGKVVIHTKFKNENEQWVHDNMPLQAVFDGLHEHVKNGGEINRLLEGEVEELMEIVAPYYDPDEFRHYHMEKIIKWYNWIREAVNEELQKHWQDGV
jgi:hypothetical protein